MNGVVIIGPTAVGKSSLGMMLAERLDGEIISIDSRQIYRGLDIGTAKASAEEQSRVRHHCIDILDITEKSNARWFADHARGAIEYTHTAGRLPILVGGSGMYLRAITHGLFDINLDPAEREDFDIKIADVTALELYSRLKVCDPESADRIHENDRYRIARALEIFELTGMTMSEHIKLQQESGEGGLDDLVRIGLDMDRDDLRSRIAERTGEMFAAGWPEEAAAILDAGADVRCPGLQTLGYPETIEYLRGEKSRDEAVGMIATLTSQYAKRQMTWFRKEPDVRWQDAGDTGVFEAVLNILDSAGIS